LPQRIESNPNEKQLPLRVNQCFSPKVVRIARPFSPRTAIAGTPEFGERLEQSVLCKHRASPASFEPPSATDRAFERNYDRLLRD